MPNPFKLLQNLTKKPALISAATIKGGALSDKDKELISKIGITLSQLRSDIVGDSQIQWDRQSMYNQITRSLDHWMVASACELYADYSTNFNQMHNASVWITSESPTYEKVLNKLLQETLGIEERIFDWAHTVAAFGNLFIKINGIPVAGITSIDDSAHPISVSRVDHDGLLIGFYPTPLGQYTGEQKLLPPWDYVHFRLLGAKKKRSQYGNTMYGDYQSMYLLTGMTTKQATTRYGTSLLINALPVYRRLRMAEDSLLLARLTRGIIRYIYKLKVDSTNLESVAELVDQYATLLKRARAIDISENDPNYDSKSNPMSAIEDIFIPVWGDTGDLAVEKIGGDANIRWIVDIEELRNQLACALRCPLSLLGGFIKDATGALGSEAIEKLDIRFARSSRRLQRALMNGIARMCQIHLSYMNMDPDATLFTVHMSETSTAEEESLKASLDTGMDIITKILDMVEEIGGLDKIGIVNYFNQKILKLEDFDLNDYKVIVPPEAEILPEEEGEVEEKKQKVNKKCLKEDRIKKINSVLNLDYLSYLPVEITEGNKRKFKSWVATERGKKVWETRFSNLKVKEVSEDEVEKTADGVEKTADEPEKDSKESV